MMRSVEMRNLPAALLLWMRVAWIVSGLQQSREHLYLLHDARQHFERFLAQLAQLDLHFAGVLQQSCLSPSVELEHKLFMTLAQLG